MIESIQGAMNILVVLLGRPKGIREIARELNVPPPTVHARLRTLVACDMVEQDRDQHYRLGPMALRLGCGYLGELERRCQVLTRARQLAQETGYSVQVGVLLGTQVLIIIHEPPPRGNQMPEPGILVPAHACALGKAILAFHPNFFPDSDGEASGHTWTLDRWTGKTITDLTTLRAQLDSVRDKRHPSYRIAEDNEEAVVGGCGVASPLRTRGARDEIGEYAIGAIGLNAPSTQPPDEGARSMVRNKANLISHDLGARD